MKNRSLIEIYDDNGIFEFQKEGFKINLKTEKIEKKWEEIDSIFAYKVDNFATDSICLDIFFTDLGKITITEETAGWFQFTKNIETTFPNINKSWEKEISIPAFKTKLTLLFSREGQSFIDAKKKYYNV